MSDQLFQHAVREWLEDGSDRTPRPAIDAVLLAVKTTPQERDLRIPRRFNLMPAYLRLAAVAAVIAVVGVGALTYIGGRTGPGGTTATPTPAPTASATPAASPTPAPTERPAGMDIQGDSASWTATIPSGWTGAGSSRVTASQGFGPPTGISLGASGAVNVPSDPCDGVGQFSDAASPADVAATLEARDDLVVSDPIDTTLGGFAGLRVDVEFPADFGACGGSFLFAEPDGSGIPALGPSNLFRIWIIDVGDRPVVFWIESFAETPASDLAVAQQIVDSIVITP